MSDIKLFRIQNQQVAALEGQSVAVEKSLQILLEQHLQDFLAVNFLASEYTIGKTHGGRIDTLGIDENGSPVIIEYKRALNENVINQGLYYLDWLLDHKGEFTLLVMKRLGTKTSENINWAGARLLCIAGEFTKFDTYAVQQINRNIELIRYKRFGEDLLLLELVNSTEGTVEEEKKGGKSHGGKETTMEDMLVASGNDLQDLYEAFKAFALALGDDVQVKTVKNYFAFKRLKNFACVAVHPQANKLVVWANINPDSIRLQDGFTRDVRKIGHHGTGDLEITIASPQDFEQAQPLIVQSYEAS